MSNQKPHTETCSYPFEEFLDDFHNAADEVHFNRFLEGGEQGGFEGTVVMVFTYIERKYGKTKMGTRGSDLAFALNYLADNCREFDVGKVAVYGSEKAGMLISNVLVKAIWEVVCNKSIGEWNECLKVDRIKARAIELSNSTPNH
ncbi:MAG: hypothetical protein AB7F75_09940 [Planctomycetota bacterium]